MGLKANFELIARYNHWMNQKLYHAASSLEQDVLAEDQRAFFGSIVGTLNHMLVADVLWMKRFARHAGWAGVLRPVASMPAPAALDQVLRPEFAFLQRARTDLDEIMLGWCGQSGEDDYHSLLTCRSLKGFQSARVLAALVQHFFNHQTHHRGQATALPSQNGVDVGVTDLVVVVQDEQVPV